MAKLAVLFVAVAPVTAPKSSSRPFNKVDNREIFMRTIELYANRDQVAQRLLCINVDDLQTVQSKYAAHLGFQGVNVAAGGPDWFGVVSRGLEKLKPEIDTVLIHDACCPAVPYTLLDNLEATLAATAEAAAVAPAMPVAGSVVKLNASKALDTLADPTGLYALQSPQIFRRAALVAAYNVRNSLQAYDDATLVHLAGTGQGGVVTIPGSEYNVRIASDELLRLAGDYLKHLPKPKAKTPLTPFDEAQW